VKFNNVLFDLSPSGAEYDPSTGAFSPKQAGVYFIECGFDAITTATGVVYSAQVVKGTASVLVFDQQASGGSSISTVASGVVQLAAGDAVTCALVQNSGASLDLAVQWPMQTFFSATRLH
jgi:hypothetical protein